MVKAVFPGSFDPPTFGHLNIIERAAAIFEELLVVVAVNPAKTCLFSASERESLLLEILRTYTNVKVMLCSELIVHFAQHHGCKVLVRGIRSVPDFSYEFELSIMNKGINAGIETIFIPTDPRFFVLRSSAIRELAAYRGDLSLMVPANVAKALKDKFAQNPPQ